MEQKRPNDEVHSLDIADVVVVLRKRHENSAETLLAFTFAGLEDC